jgi:RES domain-containing protein
VTVCTYTTERLAVRGSAKAAGRWAPVAQATVYLDHPYTTALDHTLNIDFFTDSDERSRHIALELSPESAQQLLLAIGRALQTGSQGAAEA